MAKRSSTPESNTVLSPLAVAAGAYLLSRPKCSEGCGTVATHLVSYGLRGLLG